MLGGGDGSYHQSTEQLIDRSFVSGPELPSDMSGFGFASCLCSVNDTHFFLAGGGISPSYPYVTSAYLVFMVNDNLSTKMFERVPTFSRWKLQPVNGSDFQAWFVEDFSTHVAWPKGRLWSHADSQRQGT